MRVDKIKFKLGLFQCLAVFFIVASIENAYCINQDMSSTTTPSTTPKDELEYQQWGLSNNLRPRTVEIDFRTSRFLPVPADRGPLDIEPTFFKQNKLGRKVRIAVLDTGIDKGHFDLQGKIVTHPTECKAFEKFKQCLLCPDNPEKDCSDTRRLECEKIWFDTNNPEVDLDGNGYPLDCQGWSTLAQKEEDDGGRGPKKKREINTAGIMGFPDFGDKQGHGTHVAGIIAANSGNGGIRGCTENAEILPVQVLSIAPNEPTKPLSLNISPVEPTEPDQKRSTKNLGDKIARGIFYAIHNKADVINLSLGWPQATDSELFRSAIEEAQQRGIIIVTAAGNDSTKALLRPCAYPGVICVASHDPDGAISYFSNYGPGVDIAAPGLDILSTWPREIRSVRFRDYFSSEYLQGNFEYLHGTSQATPFVSCAVAELLSQKIPKEEIYPRLILGARPHQRPVKAVTVNPHEAPPQLPIEERKELYRKYTLSGNLSIKNAYKVEPQTLILPLKKEKSVIVWNRKQSELNFDFELKNFWLGTSKNVSLVVKNIPAFEGQPEPKSIQLLQSQFAGWPQGQEKVIHGKIYIEDPFVSQISSDLEFMVSVFIDGKLHREFVIPLEIVVPVSKDEIPEGAFELAVSNLPSARTDTLPIDHVLDQNLDFVDYLLLQKKEDKWKLYLMRQDRHLDSQSAPYSVVAESEFIDKFQAKGRVLNNTSRIDIDFDGKSEYVVSFTDDRSMVGNETSPAFVYIFDENLKLKHLLTLDGVRTQMPWNPSGSNEVQWLRVGDKKVPSWVGFGYDPEAKPSLRKTWKNRNIDKRYQYFNEPEIRFYYLDYEKGLQAVSSPEGYDIIDGLAANREQLSQGRVPVLMVKGQESHQNFSSYYAEYAVGEIYNGKVENIKEVDLFTHSDQYRNLLQTRVGSVFSLDNNKGRYNGTFWFDQQKFDENRVSMIAGGDQKFIDTSVGPLRDQFDSALWARFGFYGEKIGASVFVLTNSEMQFHDMTRQQASYTSLRRYTFYPDASTNTVNFPFIIGSRNNEFADFVPTLYTTEGSGFANGVRFVVPYYEGSKLLGVYAPAQLRLKSGEGCVKVDQAFKDDLHGVSYLDYNCRDKIIRVPLIN